MLVGGGVLCILDAEPNMRKLTTPDKILTYEDMFRVDYVSFVRGLAAKKSMHVPAQDGVVSGDAIDAYVNHGRWVVECPDCTGASFVSEIELRFWCLSCGNASVNFAWRSVRMPKDREQIEAVLMFRPAARADRATTRNWTTDETVKDLQKENIDHGVVVDS